MPGSSLFRTVAHCFRTIVPVVIDLIRLAILAVHSQRALAAENLFLRKQLALFQERPVKPRRANDSTRWMMATLSRMFPWRDALVNVKASTLIRWHRQGFRLFWRWKSKPMGRPRLPKGPTTPDPRAGCGERHLGRGTHCQRTEAEARNPGLTPHRGELSARRRSGAHARSQAALADLHPQPCQGHCGL